MLRVSTVAALALSIAACARSKSTELTPASSSSVASSPAAPAARALKLCSDGAHHPGDHWKEDCNPCRCAADGDITCAHFPCVAKPDPSTDGGPKP